MTAYLKHFSIIFLLYKLQTKLVRHFICTEKFHHHLTTNFFTTSSNENHQNWFISEKVNQKRNSSVRPRIQTFWVQNGINNSIRGPCDVYHDSSDGACDEHSWPTTYPRTTWELLPSASEALPAPHPAHASDSPVNHINKLAVVTTASNCVAHNYQTVSFSQLYPYL